MRPIAVLTLGLLAGCTLNYSFWFVPVTYPPTDQIPLRIDLRLADEFCAAKYERGSESFAVGGALCQNAEQVAHVVFEEVRVTRGPASGPPAAPFDASLTPRVLLIDRNEPMWATSEQTTTVSLEWTLVAVSSGRTIWVNSFTGDGKSAKAPGMSRQEGARQQVAALLKDLFGQIHGALVASPEIRAFAARRP
jgi:hypothetical protein